MARHVSTFDPSIAAKAAVYSGILVGMGFDSCFALDFEADDIECETLPKGHARVIASNAVFIRRALGYRATYESSSGSASMGKVERGDPPSLTPVGWSGGDGMPTATMVDDWIVSLGSWASGWSEDLGSCIGNMASVAWYTDVGDLQARVSDREDTLLRSDIVPLLSHKVRKSIGESKVRGGSGLAILHALVLLYKGGKVEGRARVLRGVSHPEECTNLVQLHAALAVWEASIEEASLMSQTYTDEQLQLYYEVTTVVDLEFKFKVGT